MSHADRRSQPTLSLFAPPYDEFTPIDLSWTPDARPPRGRVLVWSLLDGAAQRGEFDWLQRRPPGLPLVVVLPPAGEIGAAQPLLKHVAALGPRHVLPHGPVAVPLRVRELLSAKPRRLPAAVAAYFARRGLLPTNGIRNEVRRILELAPTITSITRLARRLCCSRRTLGRHFAAAGLPVPSHWLQFSRLMHVAVHLQSETSTVFRAACRIGYPDGFTMSNQMKRLLGVRPTELRRRIGWEWVADLWLQQEAGNGGLDAERHGEALRRYLIPAQPVHASAETVAGSSPGAPATRAAAAGA